MTVTPQILPMHLETYCQDERSTARRNCFAKLQLPENTFLNGNLILAFGRLRVN